MKIKGLQISGSSVGLTRVYVGKAKQVAYAQVKDLELSIDTTDGSWIITEDEIISFIKARKDKEGGR